MKLTMEQQDCVSKNHNLIYWYAHKQHLDLDDWYDLLAIELCYTVVKHDPDRGSLGNYFKLRADGMVNKEIRKSMSQKRKHIRVALVGDIPDTNANVKPNEFDMVDLNHWVYGTGSEVLKLRAEGYTQSEIAEMLGTNQSYVSKELSRLRKEYEEEYKDD